VVQAADAAAAEEAAEEQAAAAKATTAAAEEAEKEAEQILADNVNVASASASAKEPEVVQAADAAAAEEAAEEQAAAAKAAVKVGDMYGTLFERYKDFKNNQMNQTNQNTATGGAGSSSGIAGAREGQQQLRALITLITHNYEWFKEIRELFKVDTDNCDTAFKCLNDYDKVVDATRNLLQVSLNNPYEDLAKIDNMLKFIAEKPKPVSGVAYPVDEIQNAVDEEEITEAFNISEAIISAIVYYLNKGDLDILEFYLGIK
jgi:hypothetical protein